MFCTVAISTSPGFRTVLVTAKATVMRVLHARQIKILFPIRPFFLERSRAIADFDPASGFVLAKPSVFHISKVLAFSNRSLAQSAILNRSKKSGFAAGLHSRSY